MQMRTQCRSVKKLTISSLQPNRSRRSSLLESFGLVQSTALRNLGFAQYPEVALQTVNVCLSLPSDHQ